jgi:hypothetical protein
MVKSKFSLTYFKDSRIVELVRKNDKKILAIWAIDCAERVLPFFEKKYPQDNRPRKAIEALQEWIKTGVFKMSVIRGASLGSHAAAREVGEDNPSRSAARAAGQAVATAHVKTHSMSSAIYALQAICRETANSSQFEVEAAISKEREWQYKHLIELINKKQI